MSGLSFSAVGESEQDRVFATLVLAFAADPVERWLYLEPRQYLSHFPEFLAAFGETVAADKHDDTFAVLGQMDAAHPTYRHWYLPWFAVDTALQGMGLGGQLMAPCLQIVDDTHLPACLETPNPRTIPFYQRHGFEVTGEAQAGTCPPITFMLRAPR